MKKYILKQPNWKFTSSADLRKQDFLSEEKKVTALAFWQMLTIKIKVYFEVTQLMLLSSLKNIQIFELIE